MLNSLEHRSGLFVDHFHDVIRQHSVVRVDRVPSPMFVYLVNESRSFKRKVYSNFLSLRGKNRFIYLLFFTPEVTGQSNSTKVYNLSETYH